MWGREEWRTQEDGPGRVGQHPVFAGYLLVFRNVKLRHSCTELIDDSRSYHQRTCKRLTPLRSMWISDDLTFPITGHL
jgi:hypothetical protein